MKSLADALGVPASPGASSAPEPDAKLTAKQLSRSILRSQQYRESLFRRIIADKLPPAVECRLYDYAYGKPVDRVELKDTTDTLTELTSAQLEAQALALAALARKLREGETGEPESVFVESEVGGEPSVH